MTKFSGLAALAAALLAVVPVQQARADDATDQFKAHVQRAKVHYDLGEFDDAAEEYIQAYRIKPVAGALFNIAQAYRQAGKYDKSRQFYRSYLREANPEGKSKLAVEKQIKELDELVAKEEKTKRSAPTGVQPSLAPPGDDLMPPPPPSKATASKPAAKSEPVVDADLTPPIPAKPAPQAAPAPASVAVAPSKPVPVYASPAAPAPAPATKLAVSDTRTRPAPPAAVATIQTSAPSGGRSHTLAYVAGGVAVALLGGGAFFGIEAARADNELTAGPHERADADTLISTSKSDHLLSAVLLGVGAAAAIGAGVLFFLPASGPSGGAGGSVGARF